MSYYENRNACYFADAHQNSAAGTHLRYAAGRGIHIGRIHSLNRVDDDKYGCERFAYFLNVFHIGFGKYEKIAKILPAAYAVSAHFNLLFRFLAGDIEYLAVSSGDIGGSLYYDC